MPETMISEIVRLAARNNAAWCDAVCRAHGRPGVFTDILWFNRRETPRFYPDAVTTAGKEAQVAQCDMLAALMEKDRRTSWAVKDSFLALDLSPLGFRPLFDGQWMCRTARVSGPGCDDIRWVRIADGAALSAWERALTDGTSDEAVAPIFVPPLLAIDGVAVFAAEVAGEIIGGGALNMAAGVVGISNVFARVPRHEDVWRGLLIEAEHLFPGATVVGYESGEDLVQACAVGFEAIGPLRVWVRP